MSPYLIYPIRPIENAMSTENPSLFIEPSFTPWLLNCRADKGAIEKCWGYSLDRTPVRPVYSINLFETFNGSRYSLYLTDTDLILKETATSKTWSYKTEMHVTGTVASMNGAKTIITGAATGWSAGGVAAGDYFIVDADLTADEEPDANWALIQSVGSDTEITLASAYTGSTTSGAYRIRKVYSLPTNERWQTAIVNNTFCFTSGSIAAQYYTGTGYAAPLDATNAFQARYCIEYANRLFLGDVSIGGSRAPLTIKWSKENDPTNWTDTTAGEVDILETEDFISGFARVGTNLVVFKRDSIHIYTRTGTATAPIAKIGERRGVGNVAPYSIAPFLNTCAFIGRDDFYCMNGDIAESIGGPIAPKFFGMMTSKEVYNVFAFTNYDENEILWFANTTEGRYVFVYNYGNKEWYVYSYPDEITAIGKGAI